MWRNSVAAARLSEGTKCGIGVPRLVQGGESIRFGKNSCIRDGAWLGVFQEGADRPDRPFRIQVHDSVYIGYFATITAVDLVEIGSGTVISDSFFASDHMHGFDPRDGSPGQQPLTSKGPVIIGKNCFVGMRVTILPGVTLGDHCVVGAHSVVTRSFPERSMVAGAPARLIKTFDTSSNEWMSVQAVNGELVRL